MDWRTVSLFELQQDGSHVVATVGVGRSASIVQVFVEESLETITAIESVEFVEELFSKLFVVVAVFLPNTVAADNYELFLSSAIDFNYVWHAGNRLLVER